MEDITIRGDRIKKLRNELFISQQELAQRIGVSKQAVFCYESNKRNPEIKTIGALAHELSCSTDYLFGISEDRNNKISEDDNDWLALQYSASRFSDDNQARIIPAFTELLDSFGDCFDNPYGDKSMLQMLAAIQRIAEYRRYVDGKIEWLSQLQKQGVDMTGEETKEMDLNLKLMRESAIQRLTEAFDIDEASINAFFPKTYAIAKHLYGPRKSGIDIDEFKEVYRGLRVKKSQKKGSPDKAEK